MIKIRTIVYLMICLCVTVSAYAQAIPNSTKSNEVLKLLLPRLNLQGEWTTLRFADGTTMTTGASGNMAAATYDPQTIAGDAFDLTLHTGTLSVTSGGTGAGDAATALSNLGAASNGANSDITSISGLTTPLAVGYGGIGTTAANLASFTLSGTTTISGNLELAPTTNASTFGLITQDTNYGVPAVGNTFIHNFNYGYNGAVTTEGWNTFVGIDAGNLTMGETATQGLHGSHNTGIGGEVLRTNTTGYSNTACGVSAMKFNTTGNYNTACGVGAMKFNTTGYWNTAYGGNAMGLNTIGNANTACGASALYTNTGNENTAVGWMALYYNTTGSRNTAVGRWAGAVNAASTTMSECVFLGYSANSSADGIVNSIAIGSTAQVTASNQVVLGNTSIVTTLLRGNVGFGTTTPNNLITCAIASATDPIADAWDVHCLSGYKDYGTETIRMIQLSAGDKIKKTPVSIFTKKALVSDEEAEREPKQKYQDKIREASRIDLELYTTETGVSMRDDFYIDELLNSMWETKTDKQTLIETNKQKMVIEKRALPKFQQKTYGIVAEDAPLEAQAYDANGNLQGVKTYPLISMLWANAQMQDERIALLETQIAALSARVLTLK